MTVRVNDRGTFAASGAQPFRIDLSDGAFRRIGAISPDPKGRQELRATFSPQKPGFHIYSIDLPPQGIDGPGIPTRLSVRGGLAGVGKPTVNRVTRLLRPAGLPPSFPSIRTAPSRSLCKLN